MRNYYLILIFQLTFSPAWAQTQPTDYFRSKAAGPNNWNANSSWESSSDGSTNWTDATLFPDADAASVEIISGHTIEINSPNVSINNTSVYGNLVVKDNDFELHGSGHTLTIAEDGTFVVDGSAKPTSGSTGQALVETGGIFKVISFSGSNNLVSNYLHVGSSSNKFKFAHHSIFDWDSNNTLGSSDFNEIFDVLYPGDLVIFKMTQTFSPTPYGSGTTNHFHALLDLADDRELRLQGNGDKIFEGGIRGEGTLNIRYDTGTGKLVFGYSSSPIATLGSNGNLILNVPHNKLELENIEVPIDAYVSISSNGTSTPNTIERTSDNLEINGTLDITNMRITNTADGEISVNNGGTIRTRNTGGLFGGGSAIVNEAKLMLQNGSTVEYYATQNQNISSGKTYYHLIFSGSGTKTPQNQTDVHTDGSITITGTPILDYSTRNLGLTEYNNTNFTMDGGKLIIGTGETQPRPGGSYSITGGEIEFTGNSNTHIKVSPIYNNIIISGADKSPGGRNFRILNQLFVTSSGELTIPSSTDTETPFVLNAFNGISVEPGGILQLENNALLMQNPGAVNSGNITQLRNAVVPSIQYNFWSSPVSNQNLYDLYPDIPDNRVMVYNTETDFYDIIPHNPGDPPKFQFGIGYSIKGPSSNFPEDEDGNTDVTATFIGTPHNESINPAENRISLSTAGQGFNLIGNPYPSNLDLKLLNDTAVNAEKIAQATFYFWDNTDNDDLYQQGSEYENQNFAIYNASGIGTGICAPRFGTTGKKPNGIIKPGQGFIVQAATTADFLEVNNAMRTSDIQRNGDYAPYFKNGNSFEVNDEIQRTDQFWLELINPNGLHIQTAVGYFEQAENTFEVYDSEILSESVSENIYTLSHDNVKLAIQGRKGKFHNDDEIPLGVKLFEQGKYKIQLEETKGIFISYQDIYLKDKLLNVIHNLSDDGAYEFEAPEGVHHERFEIVFKDGSTPSGPVLTTTSQISILKRNKQIEITSSKDKITDVEIFDLSGWPVYRNRQVNSNSLKVPAKLFNNQIIIVKVQTETGEIQTKKFVNK